MLPNVKPLTFAKGISDQKPTQPAAAGGGVYGDFVLSAAGVVFGIGLPTEPPVWE